ncbi:substrate-binding domain-containing protein [Gordonia sp. NPDC003424]
MHLGLVIPQSGPSGIFGPSCAASAELAIEEINASGGLRGSEVTVTTIDGGRAPDVVAADVAHHVRRGLDAVVGWHTSAVRRRLVRVLEGRTPYVYTAVYEGGESAPATFMTGEVPEAQLLPALSWMADELGIRRWAVVGSDYVWPRSTATRATMHLTTDDSPARIVHTAFLPLGTTRFGEVLDDVVRSGADGVLVLLLGDDAVHFNRAFGAARLHQQCVRLSPLMDENMLLGTGAAGSRGLYSVAGYFESLPTAHNLDFEHRYGRRFGFCAPPLTSPGESCYEGLALLAELARRAPDLGASSLDRAAGDMFRYDSPRGEVCFADGHVRQDVYLAAADGLEFDVVAQVSAV